VRDSCGTSVTGETPMDEKRLGGSPHAPRKASNLERKSTTLKSNKAYETKNTPPSKGGVHVVIQDILGACVH
jgi:hypothetical protein